MAGGSGEIWIGSKNSNEDGIWYWGDSSSMTIDHWDPVEDSVATRKGSQHCLCHGWSSAQYWDSQFCDEEKMYACEIEIV